MPTSLRDALYKNLVRLGPTLLSTPTDPADVLHRPREERERKEAKEAADWFCRQCGVSVGPHLPWCGVEHARADWWGPKEESETDDGL